MKKFCTDLYDVDNVEPLNIKNKYIFFIQDQYKTIFLTLHAMFKAQPTVMCTADFLHRSQTDSLAFKKEFQVLFDLQLS